MWRSKRNIRPRKNKSQRIKSRCHASTPKSNTRQEQQLVAKNLLPCDVTNTSTSSSKSSSRKQSLRTFTRLYMIASRVHLVPCQNLHLSSSVSWTSSPGARKVNNSLIFVRELASGDEGQSVITPIDF